MMKGEKPIFDRFAVIFSVAIVWIYAHLLTVGGAYRNSAPKTQITCRTDRAGIIGGAPWYPSFDFSNNSTVHCYLHVWTVLDDSKIMGSPFVKTYFQDKNPISFSMGSSYI